MDRPEAEPQPRWRLELPDPPPAAPEGELQLLASTSEPDQVSASLVFSGDTVDPDVVTRRLGVTPTVSKRPGERGQQLLFSRLESGYWRLMGERVRESSVEAQNFNLLARLPPPGPAWDALRPLHGQLFCGLFLEVWNRECHLSPAVLTAALERHLLLRLDIYYEPANPLNAPDLDQKEVPMRPYVQLSGLLFALVAIGHLIRVVRHWPLLIAGQPIPALASMVVVIVTGAMAVWAWRLLSRPPAGI
jgi:hypothetical protein